QRHAVLALGITVEPEPGDRPGYHVDHEQPGGQPTDPQPAVLHRTPPDASSALSNRSAAGAGVDRAFTRRPGHLLGARGRRVLVWGLTLIGLHLGRLLAEVARF